MEMNVPAIRVCMAVAVMIYAVDFSVTAQQCLQETGVKEVSPDCFEPFFSKTC